MKKNTLLESKKILSQSFNNFFKVMKMRGKLLICTKCGGESGNHHEDCDCKEALSKLMFLDYEISLKNQQAFFNQTD